MTGSTTTASPPAARSLREICEDACQANCGECWARPGDECVFTTAPGSVPVTKGTPLQPVRGYHVSRFAWAEAHGLISAADFAAVTDTAGSFTPVTVIYDTSQGGTMNGSGERRVLGPFETASEALLALRPGDGSFIGRESRFDLLKETLHAAGVELGEWDWAVARWLADLDVQTIASIIGWVGRGSGDYDDSPGLEPYCPECGHWVGMFLGLRGWQHFHGDPAPGEQRQLFDAGHEASPAWCQPPGRTISPADAVTIRRALAEAEGARRDRAGGRCADCEGNPAGACQVHLDDLDQADAFRDLAAELDAAGSSGEEL